MSATSPQSSGFHEFERKCFEQMTSLQAEFLRLYPIETYQHWSFDHEIGIFHFNSDDGRNLYLRYIDVGSYATNTNTWNWSWANPDLPEKVRKTIRKVKAFGEEKGYALLTEGLYLSDKHNGWRMTSIAGKILNALGLYRVESDDLHIYFVFTDEVTEDEFANINQSRKQR